MAILTTSNLLSEQRYDVSDARRIESGVRNDFDTIITAMTTGTSQGYIVRGFSIVTAGSIGSPANGLQMVVDPGSVLHIAASVSGTVFQTPIGTVNQVLNAATNTNVSGSFTANSTNYIGIDYNRFADSSTNVTKYIWNASANEEITTIAPAAQTLTFKIYITTSVWASNVLPIAIITTDGNGNVTSITDARWNLYSLETGGLNPNPSYVYPWVEGRTQPPVTITAANASANPFVGGDRQLSSFKDWANAVMTTFLEIKGTPYWFSGSSGSGPIPSLQSLFQDLGNTVITGSGEISNGILPNSEPILVTTGNITSTSNQLTSLGSVSGLSNGDYIFGTGIPQLTTIISISGSTITMSNPATLTGTGLGVSFYSPSVITAPGQINWDDPINIRVVGSSLTYTLAANPSSADISLSDDDAAYITLVRDVAITPNLIFVGGSKVVTSVGNVAWTTSLLPGDYVKIASETVSGYYQIAPLNDPTYPSGGIIDDHTVGLATVVALSDDTGVLGAKAQYAFGSYTASATPSTNRNIYVSSRADVPFAGNVFWLFLREDNGGSPRVYIRFLSQELDNGQSIQVSGTTSLELLQYIGAPSAASAYPQYTSALNPGSLPQITDIAIGAGSTISASHYFLINSSANSREYAVWFKVNGSGTAPAVPFKNAMIEVDILSSDTAAAVATKLGNAINSSSYRDFSANVGAGYIFLTSSANATVGATYTNNGQTFTVVNTVASSTTVVFSGTGAPTATGSLVKTSGTGDSTISYTAVGGNGLVTVTNTSAGTCNPASNGNIASGFEVSTVQSGTGTGNYIIHDGDSLTLAIKELDQSIGNIFALIDSPTYDETVEIVDISATPPTSLLGPVIVGTNITLPNNSRAGNIPQLYTVGAGVLQVYLNGQFLDVESGAYTEVGTSGTPSSQIQLQYALVVGDELELRLGGGGGGGGTGGGVGPAGPPGAAGPPGTDALNGPIPISTKNSSYPVLLTDGFLLGNAASGNMIFTLPTAATAAGKVFYFKKIDATANSVTVKANGVELIDGANTIATTVQYEAFSILSNGAQWFLF